MKGSATFSKAGGGANDGNPHLALVVTTALSLFFFRGQISRLRKAGFRITLICADGPQVAALRAEGAEFINLPMQRELAPLQDLKSLFRLWRQLRRIRPDIINVGTPKAALLGGIAARLARVPHRIYTLHGLRLETATGWKRRLLFMVERISCGNAHRVRCVGPSLRLKAIELNLVAAEKVYVIPPGSSNGIDVDAFRRTSEGIEQAKEIRRGMRIPEGAPVIGFVGRITRDKGINELYRAFINLRNSFPELRLLMLGDFENGDPVDPAVRRGLESHSFVIRPGLVLNATPYYAVMDVLALPSYREGLPTVCLEAQAAGVPVVTTTATGAVDSVVNGVTGKIVSPGDEPALTKALRELLENPDASRRMGQAGSAWIEKNFRSEVVFQGLIDDYNGILGRSAELIGRPAHARAARAGDSV